MDKLVVHPPISDLKQVKLVFKTVICVGRSSFYIKQDGPSLESSSYLSVSLRYLGPWNPGTMGPLDLGTLGPWDSWTSSLLQNLLIRPPTSSYVLLSLPPTLLLWYGLVRGGGMSCDIGE